MYNGKAHTPVYLRFLRWMSVNVRAQMQHKGKEPWDVIFSSWHKSREGFGTISAALKVQLSTVASHYPNKFGTTRTIPRPGRPSKLGFWGVGFYSGEWPRTQCVLFRNFAEGRPPLQACMVELPDGGFSHGSLPGVCQKAPEGLLSWETKFSVIILQKFNNLVWMPDVMFGRHQALLSTNGWNFFTLSISGIVCRIDFILE